MRSRWQAANRDSHVRPEAMRYALARHEPVYQVVATSLPTEFPPLRTLESHPNNLPMQPTT